jgi:chromosome segregation ATPase
MLETARNLAQAEAQESREQLDRAKADFDAGATDLRRKLTSWETRLAASKNLEGELSETRARSQENHRQLEKERGEFQARESALRTELEQRDQRIRELQMLVKTLGERLNDLARRHHL